MIKPQNPNRRIESDTHRNRAVRKEVNDWKKILGVSELSPAMKAKIERILKSDNWNN